MRVKMGKIYKRDKEKKEVGEREWLKEYKK